VGSVKGVNLSFYGSKNAEPDPAFLCLSEKYRNFRLSAAAAAAATSSTSTIV
jgi:hypothetical protein